MKLLPFILGSFCCIFLIACTDGLPTDDKGREDFKAFHEQYYADSIFQLQRTEFPLLGQDPEGKQDPFYWDVENWRYLKPLEKDPSIQVLPIVDMETWMRERVIIQQHFLMEKQFTLIGNQWYLTSYSGMMSIN
ncbi:MAG: hypothetical protein ACRBFS_06365 [Aureispira sp.]